MVGQGGHPQNLAHSMLGTEEGARSAHSQHTGAVKDNASLPQLISTPSTTKNTPNWLLRGEPALFAPLAHFH